MSSFALFIFEGARAEPNIARSLRVNVLNRDTRLTVQTSFGFSIYSLYQKVVSDEYFDTYTFIVDELSKRTEITADDRAVLDIEDPENISEIYLFFDYDCHCSNADDEKLRVMAELFSDAQDKGLLCVSYPMVEAIRHQKGCEIEYITHSIHDLRGYKRWVNSAPEIDHKYQNWGLYSLETWRSITEQHLARTNFLVKGTLALPTVPFNSEEVFNSQKAKHIPHGEVAVISGFPLMLLDQYGSNTYMMLNP